MLHHYHNNKNIFLHQHEYSINYFHFIHDNLYSVFQQTKKIGKPYLFIKQREQRQFHDDYYKALWPFEYVEESPIGLKAINFQLYISRQSVEFYADFKAFRQYTLEKFKIASKTRPKSVGLIQRSNYRKIVNFDAMVDLLHKFTDDVEILKFEELSTAEQIAKCSEKHVLIGSHGAGLANGMYLSPGCHIVEILPYYPGCNWTYVRFELASKACGHIYHHLRSTPTQPTRKGFKFLHSDQTVDIAQMRNKLKSLF